MEVTRADFETMVADGLDEIPEPLLRFMDNVVVLVQDESPPGPTLLGLYVGIPLTSRDSGYTFRTPDRVLIFQGPLMRMCHNREQLVHQVTKTVVHEIAHHFGIEDRELHAWGWG